MIRCSFVDTVERLLFNNDSIAQFALYLFDHRRSGLSWRHRAILDLEAEVHHDLPVGVGLRLPPDVVQHVALLGEPPILREGGVIGLRFQNAQQPAFDRIQRVDLRRERFG